MELSLLFTEDAHHDRPRLQILKYLKNAAPREWAGR